MDFPVRKIKMFIHVLPKALLHIVVAVTISACGQTTESNNVTVTNNELSVPLPSALITIDSTNLVVKVTLTGASSKEYICDESTGLTVNQSAGTYSCTIPGLAAGNYNLTLEYSIKDPAYTTPVPVITTDAINVDVVAGQTSTADFSSVPITNIDSDNDGVDNLTELNNGANPYSCTLGTSLIGSCTLD